MGVGLALVAAAASWGCGGEAAEPGTVLPFHPPPMGGTAGPTMQQSVHKWREQPSHLPADAPNIVVVMLDDAGFGQPATFGGDIATPTLSRLADEGISHTAFHTTAMCSPTRAALPTGRNHHRVGAGQIAEFANDWDGYTGIIPKSSATRPEGMPAWSDIPEDERPFQERLMEVYAGFLEHTDAQVGKLVDALEEMGIRDNTLFIYIVSDNGASAEGMQGSVAELNAQKTASRLLPRSALRCSTVWEDSRPSVAPGPTTCTTRPGPGRATRRSAIWS